MKTERRHELATNELADWLGDTIERIKPYSTAIVGTALACVVLLAAFVFYRQRSTAKVEESWSNYFAALDEGGADSLKNVAEQFASTPAGHWSRLSLADAMLAKGVQQMFDDRDAAKESLKDAADGYQDVVAQAPPDSLLAERATFGLAETYESLGELSEARKKYQAVQEHWPQGAFAGQAAARLADLDRDSTQEFYDWFASQNPKPKETTGTGSKPSFGADSLDLEKSPLFNEPSSREKTKKAKDDSLLDDSPLKKAINLRDEKPKKSPKKDTPVDEGEGGEAAESTDGDESTEGQESATDGATTSGDATPQPKGEVEPDSDEPPKDGDEGQR